MGCINQKAGYESLQCETQVSPQQKHAATSPTTNQAMDVKLLGELASVLVERPGGCQTPKSKDGHQPIHPANGDSDKSGLPLAKAAAFDSDIKINRRDIDHMSPTIITRKKLSLMQRNTDLINDLLAKTDH